MLHKMKNVRCLYFFSDCGKLSTTHLTWATRSEGLRLWVFLFNVVTQKCHINVAFGGKSVFLSLYQLNSSTLMSSTLMSLSLVIGGVLSLLVILGKGKTRAMF